MCTEELERAAALAEKPLVLEPAPCVQIACSASSIFSGSVGKDGRLTVPFGPPTQLDALEHVLGSNVTRAARGHARGKSEVNMNLLPAAAMLVMIASPAFAENTGPSPNNSPSAQSSGVGITGQPGGKNGPVARPQGQSASTDQTNQTTRLQDPSGIPGKPGSKSGPPVMPPSRSAEKQ